MNFKTTIQTSSLPCTTLGFKMMLLLVVSFTFTGYSQGIPPPVGSDSNLDEHNAVITIPEVALLDVEGANGTTISLNPTAPTEAGLAVTFPVTDTSLWLNYSSIIGAITEPSRAVFAQISAGTVPPGTSLKLVAMNDSGNGDGLIGVPTAAVSLTSVAQNIITNIGSAYTGDGVNKGHNLQYVLDVLPTVGAYGLLDFDFNETLEIIYTLSDN